MIVASPKQAAFFEEFRNVPHIWSNDKKVRFFATTPDEVHYVFNIIDNVIKAEGNLQDKNEPAPPHYVVIVTEPYLIENEALLRYMNDADNQVGITTLFAYGNITRIPKSCNAIIQSDDTRTGYYIKNKNANRFTPFALDKIEPERICAFANELSRLPIKRDTKSVDLYSLGIVLYRLLNYSRNPFVPSFPAQYFSQDEDKAFEERMSGKIPPLPSLGGEEIGRVIIRAISGSNERFQIAGE